MLKAARTLTIAGLVLAMGFSAAEAGTVTVKGAHICCGSCVNGAKKALKDVDGVSSAAAERSGGTISFEAKDSKAAEAGIKALAKAGYFGKAAHGDKTLKFPKSGAKKDAKADTVTLTGVHLCCRACVNAAAKAAEDVKGVTKVDVDKTEKTVKLTGKDIDVNKAVAALNGTGFFAKIEKKK